MSVQRIIGAILLAGGIILIVLGISASQSLGNQVSNFFRGRPTDTTLWYLIGGVASAIMGLILLLGRFARR